MPQLFRIRSLSPPGTQNNPPQLINTASTTTLSNTADKTPLWVQKSAVSPTTTTGYEVPMIAPSTTAPVLPITRPFGAQTTMVMQSTPMTSMVGKTSSPNHLPSSLMYRPLLAPVLTVFPSSSSLTSSMFLTNSFPATTATSNNLSIESLVNNPLVSTVGKMTPQQQQEVIAKFTPKPFMAEPATGQVISVRDRSTSPSNSNSFSPQLPRTLASIPDSELTEQYLEVKAFAEDFKTRRIRLGFTQGAVGKSLAERGYSNFAQSTISRFEQMQLSPSNAATIRVILEKWLLEAENPEPVQSNSSSAHLSEMASRKRKKRAVFAPMTKSTLDDFFLRNPRPNRQDIEEISSKLDLLPEEVRVWFCNKRQKSKPSSLSSSYSYEHDSSHSPTSSVGVPSPPPATFGDMGMAQKRRSPTSPKTTLFTIEELSKSSSSQTVSSSPLISTCPSLSPVGLVGSITHSRVFPMLFNPRTPFLNNPLNNPIMPQFIIPTQRLAQTTA